jgi:hypothetical protein
MDVVQMADWMCSKAIYATLGASNHTSEERADSDYYATDPTAVDALLSKATLHHDIWECACGAGHLSKRLIERGYNVKSTDIADRGYGISGVDFLKCDEHFDGDILTNPPFKYAQEFVEHGLSLVSDGCKVLMFLRLQFLEGKKRRRLYDTGALKTVYVFSNRIPTYKNGADAEPIHSAMAFAWFEVEKGYKGKPVIEWLDA